jgi:hypothetical protein
VEATRVADAAHADVQSIVGIVAGIASIALSAMLIIALLCILSIDNACTISIVVVAVAAGRPLLLNDTTNKQISTEMTNTVGMEIAWTAVAAMRLHLLRPPFRS